MGDSSSTKPTIASSYGTEYHTISVENIGAFGIENATASIPPDATDINFDNLEFTKSDNSTQKIFSGSLNGANLRYLLKVYFDPLNGQKTSENVEVIVVKG